MLELFVRRLDLLEEQVRIRSAVRIGRHTGENLLLGSVLSEKLGDKADTGAPAIPHPRLEVREIVSPGAREAVGQIRIGFVGGGRAGKYTR